MSTTQRLILFLSLSLLIMLGSQALMLRFGIIPPPAAPKAEQDQDQGNIDVQIGFADRGPHAFAGEPDSPYAFAPGYEPPKTAPELTARPPEPEKAGSKPEPARNAPAVPSSKLVLGDDDPASAYRMKVQLRQAGASVSGLTLAHHEAEHLPGQPEGERLKLLEPTPGNNAAPPFSLTLIVPGEDIGEPSKPYHLESARWEVVTDAQGRYVSALPADEKAGLLKGQQVVFRARVPEIGVTVQKLYQLREGTDGFRIALEFQSDRPRKLAYRLTGPHGLPIEGEWYTSTFRDAFFGKISPDGSAELETHTAQEVADADLGGEPLRITTLPLKFAGVENQYFAVFLEPDPLPSSPDKRWDALTEARAVEVPQEKQKSDVTVVTQSKPFSVAPNAPVSREYRVFAGPKDVDTLAAFGADDLATYRKGWQIWVIGPLATYLAKTVIGPLLTSIYNLTAVIAGWFGFSHGNYGIAIILLTITVRLCLLPLSRKQALAAKKMQDMAPHMQALREKHKDEKEKLASESMALYRKYGVSPFGGCLLALIQMPIFFGLWRALNNSVALRGSSFLWIDNLAAPDMLFRFPMNVPLLGEYFNLLPFLVVGLMLVHTKLFSPPATTPEQEMSQKMMKYMMVFMAFMFYRVPSGLGLYFITSSSWAIAERVYLPRHLKSNIPAVDADDSPKGGGKPAPAGKTGPGGKSSAANGASTKPKPGGWRDRLREKLEEVMEEANKDKTYRKPDTRDRDPKNRPRPKPGRRR